MGMSVEHLPPIWDEKGSKPNPFIPNHEQNGHHNYFELDITKYASPHWWTLAFCWISFFPLTPSFFSLIFKKLFMPRSHHHVFDKELGVYSMPLSLSNKWLQVDHNLSDTICLICRYYQLPFVYPIYTSSFGYSKGHKWSGVLMALCRGRDWFMVWMALLSYVITGAKDIYLSIKDSVILTKAPWYDILFDHFDTQWLEALHASTVCSFSPYTPHAGVFLKLEVFNSYQPLPEFFCWFHVPVWYPWSSYIARRYMHLAALSHQLQEGTTFLTKSPHSSTSTLMPSLPLLAGSSTWSKHITWAEFILKCKQHYEEWVKKETPQQQLVWLAHLCNPPKISTKVFEWQEDNNGDLWWQAVPKKMCKDILYIYPTHQIYYDPIENEYNCCEEYDSGAPGGGPLDDDNTNDGVSWNDDDVGMN